MIDTISEPGQATESNRPTGDATGQLRADSARPPAELRELQSMAVMGELAEAVAHDFNNIVSAVLIHLGLLLQDSKLSAAHKESLRTLEQETARAAGLTRQLLSFSRRRLSSEDEAVDLNGIIQGMEKLLKHLVRENVAISFQPFAEECWIKAEIGQVEKLLMSLCLVFRDAMPRGGRLMLTTSVEAIDRAPAISASGQKEKFICLTLTATGPEDSILPLPTSESADGDWKLETARQITLRHHGWIDVGLGRPELRVHLPSVNACDRTAENSAIFEKIKGGSETILLVEDESFLRRVSALSLRKLGYAVLDAPDGEAALKLWAKHHAKIDLVLADLMLPGAESGYELARLFTSQKPSLRVMLCSGNPADLDEVMNRSGPAFFPAVKPYTVGRLATWVRECLDSPI